MDLKMLTQAGHRVWTAALPALCLGLLLPAAAYATDDAAAETTADTAAAQTASTAEPTDITVVSGDEAASTTDTEGTEPETTDETVDEDNVDANNVDGNNNESNDESADDEVQANKVRLVINSKQATVRGADRQLDAAPYAVNGTTMLPLRFIAQDILNAAVEWDSATGLVRVKKDALAITIDLTNGKVYSGGEPYKMTVAPEAKEGRTFVPLRLITELMDCAVQYNAADRSIDITLPVNEAAEPPVASITYETATAGQDIPYQDASYDPAGYLIVDREWTVTAEDGFSKTGSSLYWLFYTRQGGDYTISYRVKSETGLWSEPVTSEYYLEPNQAPEITRFEAPDMTVDIGEALDIEYEFVNEEWEKINGISFTYSWEDDAGQTVTKTGLPQAFFREGEHTVAMRVQDAFGQWSETAELVFEVSPEIAATEAEFKFTNLNPGEIYLNLAKYNFSRLTQAETTEFTTSDVTLLDSNSPEKVNTPGILYKDTATGSIALHYHHLNNSGSQLKFLVIAHNETDQPLTFTIGKQGFAGPSADPMQVGYIENQNYLASQPQGKTVTLQPGQKYLLNSGQTAAVNPTYLQSALIDVTADGQLSLVVAAVKPGFDYQKYLELPLHDAVGPQTRGTYQQAAYNISVQLGNDTEKIMLGYPDSFSAWIDNYLLTGVDSMTGEEACNKGNYGMIQNISLTATRRTGVLLNPRGSIYRGALLWNGELCLLSSTGQIKTTQEGVVLGVIEAGETVTITYITPDGSDSPVLLVAIPEREWDEF